MSPSEQGNLLEVRGLRTWFPIRTGVLQRVKGHIRAVDGVEFNIRKGETLALVGESGCGKSTLGYSILQLIESQEGQVSFNGQDLCALPPEELKDLRRKLQIVFQDPMAALNPRARIRDSIAEGMECFGIGDSDAERTQRVAELMERVGLDPRQMDRYPHEFSGGQRQRICVVRALAVEPEFIVLDESVSALDVSIQAQMLNLLQGLQEEFGLTYLFITHDLGVVRYVADRVAVMYLGQIVEEGSTEQIFSAPRHPYTRILLSAVPSVDPDERTQPLQVRGEVPSPSNPPSGCRFHPRCPDAVDRCSAESPDLEPRPGGGVRCFLAPE
ncbi:MAG: ATP-binding cassette domain-containing protein [Deltaproteobacteria bacterium]|nr:ATP-binding cassette domain-containing protein [Deltaproteobacteria bacterium]